MPGLMPNTRKITQLNGLLRLHLKPMVLMMLLLKKDKISLKPQQFQITTTESMPGLMPNTRKITQLNGLLRPHLKPMVLMMLLLKKNIEKDIEFQETLSFHLKHQQPQIITT
jgi:hypothetical protein